MGGFWKTLLVLGVGVLPNSGAIATEKPSPRSQAESAITAESHPPLTQTPRSAEIALAEHLTQVGATLYGTEACNECKMQKEWFGPAAFQKLNYIECSVNGNKNIQAPPCQAAQIRFYPTWRIKGREYIGAQSLNALSQASNYPGPHNFQTFPRSSY